MSSHQLKASFALLRTRVFGTFWFAMLLSNIGFWAQEVAEPWLLLTLGASAFLIGLDAFVGDAPALLLTLVGGVLADHFDRRRIIAVFQSIEMLCPIALVVLLLTGSLQAWMVIGLSLVVGITDALSMPSYQSIVPSIVKRRQLATGIALSSTQYNLSRILGPACAGLLIAAAGVIGCFVVNALSYIPFILVALWILPRRVRGATTARLDHTRLRADLRAAVHEPHVRIALLVIFATSLLCGPLITFCPLLVRDAFGHEAGGFSLVIAAFGIGGLLGAVVLLGLDPVRDRRPLASWCAIGCGALVIVASIQPWFELLPVLVLAVGFALTVSNTATNTLLQTTGPASRRGQTVSMYMLAIRSGMALGSLVTGATVHVLGVRAALAINGGVAVGVQLEFARRWQRTKLPTTSRESGPVRGTERRPPAVPESAS